MKYSRSTIGSLFFVALSAMAFTACNGGTEALTPEAQVARFCGDTAAPVCEALFTCCTDPAKLESLGLGMSVEECKNTVSSQCTTALTATVLPLIKAGGTVLDAGRLATCVADLEKMKSGGAACVEPSLSAFQFDCISSFQGTSAQGAACDASMLPSAQTAFLPCQDGFCQDGKCKPLLATGNTCLTAETDPATASLCNFPKKEWCIGAGTTGRCGPRARVGETCGVPGREGTLACESTSCGADGKCAAATVHALCSSF